MTTIADQVTYRSVAAGASARVYGSRWATHRDLGADLAPITTSTLPLPILRHPTTVEDVHA
jgi:hypothetical protein